MSKAWCDLVFEGRNRSYGAYQIRRRTGRRYAWALGFILGCFLLTAVAYTALLVYHNYRLRQDAKEAEELFKGLRYDNLKEGYKVKFQATARMKPVSRLRPGQSQTVPQLTDNPPRPQDFGIDGKVCYDVEQDILMTPIVDTTNLSKEDMPLVQQKVVPTEVVRQMPEFPGGPRAFMQWLNDRIVYPATCYRLGRKGVVTLTFLVDEEGHVAEPEVKDSFDPRITRSALRAMQSMPQFKPATDDTGRPTTVRITVPVEFKLLDGEAKRRK